MATKSPSKHLSLEFLRELQDSYYMSIGGIEYDPFETDQLIAEKENSLLDSIDTYNCYIDNSIYFTASEIIETAINSLFKSIQHVTILLLNPLNSLITALKNNLMLGYYSNHLASNFLYNTLKQHIHIAFKHLYFSFHAFNFPGNSSGSKKPP